MYHKLIFLSEHVSKVEMDTVIAASLLPRKGNLPGVTLKFNSSVKRRHFAQDFFSTPSCERPTKMPGLCGCLSEMEACESFVIGDPPEKGLTHLKI